MLVSRWSWLHCSDNTSSAKKLLCLSLWEWFRFVQYTNISTSATHQRWQSFRFILSTVKVIISSGEKRRGEKKESYEASLVKSSLILRCCTNLYEKADVRISNALLRFMTTTKMSPRCPLLGSRTALSHHQARVITAPPSVQLARRPLISYIIWLFRIPWSSAAWQRIPAAPPGSWQRPWWTVWAGAGADRRTGPEAELRVGRACWPGPGSPAAAAGQSPAIPECMGSPAGESGPGSPPGRSACCSRTPGCCWSSCSPGSAPAPGTPRVRNTPSRSRSARGPWSGSVGKSGQSQKRFSTCCPKSKSNCNSHRESLI